MPALLVDTNTPTPHPVSPADTSSSTTTEQRDRKRSESRSPNRPPVSPITPTVSAAQLAPLPPPPQPIPHVGPSQHAVFRPQPPSVPISESDNPDAIALRSAISLLQLQREKSKRDLKTLEELKAAAVSDPQGFVRSIQAQRSHPSKPNVDPLSPTLSDVSGSLLGDSAGTESEQRTAEGRKDSASMDSQAASTDPATKFPPIPQPQNIIRCPPVNWAKYHIVGESLDKLHKEQKQYPGSVEPPRNQQGAKAPPHAVSAPYSPFTDSVGESHPAQSWRGSKKSPS
ncbi:hypothetical protein K505DRAFT_141286 [Melanomma pulvis-pyrius CBS 109.77]|uniref:Uncharacterized protein n=1 Tax=Melanomma pulvis-pyrius CBS 109.77 TaxID=1314802 RepID=A0A6A6WRV6_9PLEO|nr:hypothetical protein K505DRAFT_141286 [Melanomma pulvis-pyrius CBS 109.77]